MTSDVGSDVADLEELKLEEDIGCPGSIGFIGLERHRVTVYRIRRKERNLPGSAAQRDTVTRSRLCNRQNPGDIR